MANCGCGASWTGHKMEHCTSCHRTFTGTSAGDKHRTGEHAVSRGARRRRCRTDAELEKAGLRPNEKKSGLIVWGSAAQRPLKSLRGLSSDGLECNPGTDAP